MALTLRQLPARVPLGLKLPVSVKLPLPPPPPPPLPPLPLAAAEAVVEGERVPLTPAAVALPQPRTAVPVGPATVCDTVAVASGVEEGVAEVEAVKLGEAVEVGLEGGERV